VHSAGSDIYSFNRNGLFTGNAADEAVFDFDTDQGTGATPFTVVFYASVSGRGESKVGMINKQTDSQNSGWNTGLVHDDFGLNNVTTELRTNDNRTILFTPGSAADPFPNTLSAIGVTASALNLYVVHVSGVGQGATAVDVYINGGTSPANEVVYSFGALVSSMLNNAPLRIGGTTDRITASEGLAGTIRFIEIWSGSTAKALSPANYSAWRFANLNAITKVQTLGAPVPKETFCFDFQSEANVMYRLESTLGLPASPWTDTGMRVLGDGEMKTFYSPEGLSAHKIYRMSID
jgi:hypothetical protein